MILAKVLTVYYFASIRRVQYSAVQYSTVQYSSAQYSSTVLGIWYCTQLRDTMVRTMTRTKNQRNRNRRKNRQVISVESIRVNSSRAQINHKLSCHSLFQALQCHVILHQYKKEFHELKLKLELKSIYKFA